MASSQRVDFVSQIQTGEMIEVVPRVVKVGRSSMRVTVELFAENLQSATRRSCGLGTFVMVAVDEKHRPIPAIATAA